MDPSPPEKRVGDRERKEVDDRLRAAHDDGMLTLIEYDERSKQCFGARTRAELDELTADLPDPPAPEPVTATAAPAPTRSIPVPESVRRKGLVRGGIVPAVLAAVVAVVGFQTLSADDSAIFGSNRVQVNAATGQVDVGVLFGSTRVVVPDGVRATLGGTVVFGSKRCAQACAAPGPATVEIDGHGGFGSIEVVTPAEDAQGGLRNNDDDDGDNDDD